MTMRKRVILISSRRMTMAMRERVMLISSSMKTTMTMTSSLLSLPPSR